MKFLLLFGWFLGLSTLSYSQSGTLNIIGDSSLVSCDSTLSFAIYNAQTPPTLTGDFHLTSTGSVAGSYSLVVTINWGDGTTSTHQATANNINAGNLISFNPALQHAYTALGTYSVSLSSTSSNGGPLSYHQFNYTQLTCGYMTVPTTGNNTVYCGNNVMLYDAGGPNGNYNSNSSGYTILSNSGSSQISISGSYTYLESYYDTLKIYAGAGTSGQLLYTYCGTNGGTFTPFTSQPGQTLTVQLKSDIAVNGAGFAMQVQYTGSCAPISYQVFAIAGVDCNNDGNYETTINSGIPITLTNGTASYSGTTFSGNYIFSNVTSGTYTLAIDPTWLNTNGYVINSISPSTMVTVNTTGADTFAIYLGCAVNSSVQCLSGAVYADLNGNGIFDNGENTISNAQVVLNYNGQDYIVYSGLNGTYNFSYNGFTNDSIWVGLNPNWLAVNGCNAAQNGTYVLSSACNSGLPTYPVNIGLNCITNTPTYCYSGFVYCDANSNGTMNPGEVGIPNAPVYLGVSPTTNNTIIVYTDSSGYYNYCGQIGSTATASAWVNTQWLNYQGYTALNPFITVLGSTTGSTTPGNIGVNCGGTPCSDVWTTVTPWIGYYQNSTAFIKLNWGSYGPLAPGNYQLTFSYPAGITLNTSSIQNTGYTINGNTITWNLTNNSGSFSNYDYITFQIPGGLTNGAQHHFSSTISLVAGTDCNTTNNAGNLLQILGNSYDPNDKTVERPSTYINSTAPVEALEGSVLDKLTYTIRFQNTGTAPAQNIVIVDTLSANLDWSTFALIESSHPVQIIHDANGRVRFEFNQIWLPDSSSNEPASHGELVYEITENNACGNGCSIENTAYIYFDWNDSIITNTTFNINGDLSTELNAINDIQLYPNPTTATVQLKYPGTFTFACFDLFGKCIQNGTGENQQMINLAAVDAGIYIVKVTTATGQEITKRIVRK